VTNSASVKDSFNNNPITSLQTVALVLYKQPTNDKDNDGGPGYGGYGGAVVPVVPLPVMSGSPMYGSVPDGYGSEPDMYTSGPSTTEIPYLESNVHKTKAQLSKHKHKHKHKHHTTKHHKTGKNNSKQRN